MDTAGYVADMFPEAGSVKALEFARGPVLQKQQGDLVVEARQAFLAGVAQG
jgi:hypothetical protein